MIGFIASESLQSSLASPENQAHIKRSEVCVDLPQASNFCICVSADMRFIGLATLMLDLFS